jgi:NTP pyrophosphatase (non-canonical NTP hydrolase)
MDAVDINTGNLRELARVITEHLRANGFPAEGAANRQVLALAEECGEFVGSYRRWSGQARRSGTAEEMHAELADVVITAFAAAEELGIDLDEVITAKANVVLTRGWREQAPAE